MKLLARIWHVRQEHAHLQICKYITHVLEHWTYERRIIYHNPETIPNVLIKNILDVGVGAQYDLI